MALACRLVSLHRHSLRCAAMALLGLIATAAEAGARAPTGADRCFAPGELARQAGEEAPRRGAPGAHAAVPKQALGPPTAVPPPLRGAIRRVELPKGLKLVALTLDLCEQPGEVAGYDGAIVDYLRQAGIRATFFAGGKWMVTHAERTRQLLADPLFELGNHAWAHRNLRGLSGTPLQQEIHWPQLSYAAARTSLVAATAAAASQCAALAARAPERPRLFRFPFGACSPASLSAVADNGLLAIQWDVSTGDAAVGQSALAIANLMVNATRPGSIILVHANGRGHHTAQALPLAIPRLQAAGYRFVTVSELLAAGKPVIADTCYDARPGDTDRYDALFRGRSKPGDPSQTGRAAWPSAVIRRGHTDER